MALFLVREAAEFPNCFAIWYPKCLLQCSVRQVGKIVLCRDNLAILILDCAKTITGPLGCLWYSCTMLSLRNTNQNGHRQMSTLSWKHGLFTSVVTMVKNKISCIGTCLSQYIICQFTRWNESHIIFHDKKLKFHYLWFDLMSVMLMKI